MRRLRLSIGGAVQGVGFRPFVYRLASEAGLAGWVSNTPQGVLLEVEGEEGALASFREAIENGKPPLAVISGIATEWLEPVGHTGFEIRTSTSGRPDVMVLPDMATCPDCLREVLDPSDRRFGYPFTNCTNCGPRYSIIRSLPYDRASTTMAGFEMCPDCLREYRDPADRRFHAQPNACPVCGPSVEMWDTAGSVLSRGGAAISECVSALLADRVVAVKGLGGFHLMVRASSPDAIAKLRGRKRRRRKPLAVMFPSMESIREQCFVSGEEERLLASPRAPIVLLRRREDTSDPAVCRLPETIAPGNPCIGAMLPYTPLHHIVLRELDGPVVATSGNLSDEPICIDGEEALERLSGLADLFIVHDRPIRRHVDDSIVRVVDGETLVLRRARGYAPMPLDAGTELPTMLAFGAHLKNTVALSLGRNVHVSQHIGDLETPQAVRAFDDVRSSVEDLYHARPERIVHDLHPDYISTSRAKGSSLPTMAVQHHLAHIASCMLDTGTVPPVTGLAWDGTGFGTDGTIWGGEVFHIGRERSLRVGHIRTFPLPGGGRAVKEPGRSAAGLLFEMGVDPFVHLPAECFSGAEREGIHAMLRTGTNTPLTSSAGRLFDAVAALCGFSGVMEFEGEAAMDLEYALPKDPAEESYPARVLGDLETGIVLDWEPLFDELLLDVSRGVGPSIVSMRFHNAMIGWIVAAAELVGEERVALSGGCFQNTYLITRGAELLRKRGFEPLLHRMIPPGDGGIAPGQIFAAACLPPLTERS